MAFASVPDGIEQLRRGGLVIVVDDEDRENEGDLIGSAEHVTAEQMAMMIRFTSGIVFLAVSNEIADQLDLPPMVARNTSKRETPFTVSIEATDGVETGVSAKDRVHTVRTAINPVARPDDLSRPGHIFPLRAKDGGVLVRAGHTEASVDLCRLAGLRCGAVGAELMHDDGTMMRLPALMEFGKQHGFPVLSIADLIAYRRRNEIFVRKLAESELETENGSWTMSVFEDVLSKREHVALACGTIDPLKPALVRVHSECITGDVFGSCHCDCGSQLKEAMRRIAADGSGVVLYMRQEGRGIGLVNKVRAYALQQQGLDTVEANERLGFPMDLRDYGIGAQILRELGVGKLRLLTNNPRKIVGLQGYGLEVIERVPLEVQPRTERERAYLRAKKEKMGHELRDV